MPIVKGNTLGTATRFKTDPSVHPAGRSSDPLRRSVYAEFAKIERETWAGMAFAAGRFLDV